MKFRRNIGSFEQRPPYYEQSKMVDHNQNGWVPLLAGEVKQVQSKPQHKQMWVAERKNETDNIVVPGTTITPNQNIRVPTSDDDCGWKVFSRKSKYKGKIIGTAVHNHFHVLAIDQQ